MSYNTINNFEDSTFEEYKMTELGPIPSDWEIVKLNNIGNVKGGKRLPKGHSFSNKVTEHPYIRIVDFQNFTVNEKDLKYLTNEDYKILNRYIINHEDVYISIAGTIGIVGTIPKNLNGSVLTENAARIVIEKKVIKDFLVMYLSSKYGKTEIDLRKTKTSQPKLALSRIKEIPVIVPPILEQKKIASVLLAIQEAIEKTEAIIEATKLLKKALMKYLFTYGPVPVEEAENIPLKETEIGLIPEDWEVLNIGSIASVKGGYAFKSSDYVSEGVPLLRISNVSFGKAIWDEIAYLPHDYANEYKDYLLKNNDLIMAMTRPIVSQGIKVAKLSDKDVPCLLNQRVCRFNLTDKINREYLFQILFDKNFISSISGGAIGSQQPNISATKIESIPVPIPPRNIQEKIAQILSAIDIKLNAEQNNKRAIEELFKTMLNDLMTAKIRVNNLEV